MIANYICRECHRHNCSTIEKKINETSSYILVSVYCSFCATKQRTRIQKPKEKTDDGSKNQQSSTKTKEVSK